MKKKVAFVVLGVVILLLTLSVANTGPFPARFFNVEIGGGYGNTGVSMDKDGNVDIAGDVRIDGTLTGGSSRKTPVMFSAGNGNPTSTGGCTAKALNANDQTVLEFANGQQAVWDLPAMPSDFDGSIENIVITYRQKGTTGAITFKYGTDPVAEGTDPVKPTLTSLNGETPGTADKTYYFSPSASSMLGTSANANLEMIFWLQIDIAAGGNVELLGVRVEY